MTPHDALAKLVAAVEALEDQPGWPIDCDWRDVSAALLAAQAALRAGALAPTGDDSVKASGTSAASGEDRASVPDVETSGVAPASAQVSVQLASRVVCDLRARLAACEKGNKRLVAAQGQTELERNAARLAQAQAEREWESEREAYRAAITAARGAMDDARLERQRADSAEARAAGLLRYVQHDPMCGSPSGDCTCGLDAALGSAGAGA